MQENGTFISQNLIYTGQLFFGARELALAAV